MILLLLFQMARFAEENHHKFEMRNARELEDIKDIDCGDKTCFLSYHFEQVCKIFLPTNSSKCNIPCMESGCEHEIHKAVMCPIWTCSEYSTTTSTSSTSSTTTSTTPDDYSTTTFDTTTSEPPNPADGLVIGFWISILFNFVFVLGFSLFAGLWIKKQLVRRRLLAERAER